MATMYVYGRHHMRKWSRPDARMLAVKNINDSSIQPYRLN